MGQPSKKELEQQNEELREALEEIYDRVADLLELEDEDDASQDK